jgi:hypothetical protein
MSIFARRRHPGRTTSGTLLLSGRMWRRCAIVLVCCFLGVAGAWRLASAQGVGAVDGVIVGPAGNPVAGAAVTLEGGGLRLATASGRDGRFAFPALPVGRYLLEARAGRLRAIEALEVTEGTVSVAVRLLPTVSQVRAQIVPVTAGSGTDVAFDRTTLERMPSQGSLQATLALLPAAAAGANGVVHINGDHGDIAYVIDGVSFPQALNREIGSEIDPADIAFMDVLEGAYPARYGGRFAAVVDISTLAEGGAPGFRGALARGSFDTTDTELGYHAPLGDGNLTVHLHANATVRALDPPDFVTVHDQGASASQYLGFEGGHGRNAVTVAFIHALQTFQVPNDVTNGEPATTDDTETQDDAFLAVQAHHALRGDGALSYGLGFKQSRVYDGGDPSNDFIYGEALNLAAGGAPQDCANGVVSACAFSLTADRRSRDLSFDVGARVASAAHIVRWGAVYDLTTVAKHYAVTLQPGNFLAPILTPSTPNAAVTVSDDAPNVAHVESAYLQDTWTLSRIWRLEYGVRADAFQIFSTQFDRGFSQVSPRLKLTRLYGPHADGYFYVGRFFTPFSFENVSPTAARLLNLPLQPTVAQFDLKPERDTDIEIGGHLPVGSGELGLRVMQKLATDLIDDTQVGVTALHQDINYARGDISVQSAVYQRMLPHDGRLFMTVSHVRAENKGCETQLLAPCFGSPTDWTPADHDQRWEGVIGGVIGDRRGDWTSATLSYGSGLSSAFCRPVTDDCKVPPHTVLDLERGIALGHDVALVVRMSNLLNDRYYITYENAQGNHVAPGRAIDVRLVFGRR